MFDADVPVADAAMPGRAAAANAPFHHLHALPRALWQAALVCSSGATDRRLPDLSCWQRALQAGRLPDAGRDWGDPDACAALRGAITDLDLCALTQGSAAMARQVLGVMLWHL
ncbi:MAG: hypothetical protein KDH93_23815, partial [Rhodoferax sp.]|nr:hypothetical protein [Rhodoferax sp.]